MIKQSKVVLLEDNVVVKSMPITFFREKQ